MNQALSSTTNLNEPEESFRYDDDIVKKFLLATLIWGAVALLLGVFIATQLANWKLNFGLPWTTFGRLRPLHTNAAIFAFAGNGIFAALSSVSNSRAG
jgi:cytochrome c oxidase cbb3-type subunit I/II